MQIEWVAALFAAVVLLALLGWLAVRARRLERAISGLAGDPAGWALLQREIQSVRQGVDHRLAEQLAHSRDLSQRLGRLQAATEEVERLGRDIAELQKILGPPQLRGPFGERLLEDLLSDVLPRERFRVQHTFKSGVRVDAAILLEEGRILPIDAKFPLENFRRFVQCREEGRPEAEAARRDLERDVRGHIDAIASRYLSPEDGTVNVALMYIPSESVYYEVALRGLDGEHEPIAAYALSRRVVPVSPNSMHAYLCVILMGLRGLQLQQRAREIRDDLGQLHTDVSALRQELNRAMRQAQHSLGNLGDVDRVLQRIELRLDRIQRGALPDEAARDPA